jgi:DNA-directed RNA polymerase subunit RPC12/RpoP
MKFKKKSRGISPAKQSQNDKVVISSEYYQNDRPSYLCSFCNQTLIRLTDSSQQNSTYWCRHCGVEFDPESENLRKESKITVPDRNAEPAITSVSNTPDVSIRHEPELKGAFKALKDKGLRFTHYEDSSQ